MGEHARVHGMTRRQFLWRAVAGTSAALAAARGAEGAAASVKRGGVLRVAKDWTYPTLDPHLSSLPSMLGYRMLFDSLLRHELNEQTGRLDPKPELAEAWERTDDRTFVFRLRKGVKFHDGSDFTAEVAKWNIDRMRTHPKSTKALDLTAIQSVEVVGPSAIRINLKSPLPGLLAAFSAASGRAEMLAKAAVDKLGDEGFARRPVGSGPMQFVEWVPDDRLTLKRFEGFWQAGADGKPLPYLDGAVFRVITDPAVSILELRSGALDFTDGVEAKDVARLKAIPDLVYREIPQSGYVYFTLGFNPKGGPFATNLKLRQAALHALNRPVMARTLGLGIGRPHYHPYWGPGMIGYDESLPRHDYNPERARELVREAGHPSGVHVTLSVINRAAEMRIAEMVQQAWDAVGIRTTLETFDRLAWINKVTKTADFHAAFWRGGLSMDPDYVIRNIGTGAPGNWTLYSNPTVDKCMEEGRSTYDDKARHEIYKRCQRLMVEDAFVASGYLMPQNAVYHKSVKGVRVASARPEAVVDLREVWLDR